MRYQCSNCFSEFFDDAPSSTSPARVFCVFCGKEVGRAPSAAPSAVPFSASHSREESFALGVIGSPGGGFPDTLRQFRAHGTPRGSDSIAPVHVGPDGDGVVHSKRPWRLRKFWTALAVGFGVGAAAALLFGKQPSAPRAAVVVATVSPPSVALPPTAPSPVPGCVASAPSAAAPAASEPKPRVTPLLEKRFWLERARSAQHNYRLGEAERFYRRALAQAPRDSEVLSGLGEIELLRGQREAARARFREALEANSDYVPARVALADLHWQSGRTEVARSEYRALTEQYSADLLPSYVNDRLETNACVPKCGEEELVSAPPADAESPAPSPAY